MEGEDLGVIWLGRKGWQGVMKPHVWDCILW